MNTHGFTREALSQSVLHLRDSAHTKPLHDTAVSALFGSGDKARVALIHAWLDEGIANMSTASSSAKEALHSRLQWNESVLHHLPEVRIPIFIFRLLYKTDVNNNVRLMRY